MYCVNEFILAVLILREWGEVWFSDIFQWVEIVANESGTLCICDLEKTFFAGSILRDIFQVAKLTKESTL